MKDLQAKNKKYKTEEGIKSSTEMQIKYTKRFILILKVLQSSYSF